MDTGKFIRERLGGKLLGARNYLECFPIQATDDILDVGCGKGTELVAYWKSGTKWHSAVGVDYDAACIREAQDIVNALQIPLTTFRVADAAKLPFGDAAFDKVLAIDLIQYVAKPQQAFNELLRVLKPGGLLLITFPGFWHRLLTGASRLKSRLRGTQWRGGGSLSVSNWTISQWLALANNASSPAVLIKSRATTLFPPLQRYGVARFWFTNNAVHAMDSFFGSLPALKRFGQALMCVYRKA